MTACASSVISGVFRFLHLPVANIPSVSRNSRESDAFGGASAQFLREGWGRFWRYIPPEMEYLLSKQTSREVFCFSVNARVCTLGTLPVPAPFFIKLNPIKFFKNTTHFPKEPALRPVKRRLFRKKKKKKEQQKRCTKF